MAKKFLGAKNLQIRGKPGQGASTEAKIAHAQTKADAFNDVASQARALGLNSHAQSIENNLTKINGKLSRLQSLNEKEGGQITPEPFVRVLLPGVGEKVNVVA